MINLTLCSDFKKSLLGYYIAFSGLLFMFTALPKNYRKSRLYKALIYTGYLSFALIAVAYLTQRLVKSVSESDVLVMKILGIAFLIVSFVIILIGLFRLLKKKVEAEHEFQPITASRRVKIVFTIFISIVTFGVVKDGEFSLTVQFAILALLLLSFLTLLWTCEESVIESASLE